MISSLLLALALASPYPARSSEIGVYVVNSEGFIGSMLPRDGLSTYLCVLASRANDDSGRVIPCHLAIKPPALPEGLKPDTKKRRSRPDVAGTEG